MASRRDADQVTRQYVYVCVCYLEVIQCTTLTPATTPNKSEGGWFAMSLRLNNTQTHVSQKAVCFRLLFSSSVSVIVYF
jgi:hypothetical protein